MLFSFVFGAEVWFQNFDLKEKKKCLEGEKRAPENVSEEGGERDREGGRERERDCIY